jgi:hypothetical protein
MVQECKLKGHHYRVAYTSLEPGEILNAQLSIAARVLYEAFKYSLQKHSSYSQFWNKCRKKYTPQTTIVDLPSVFCFIASAFKGHTSRPMIIINLDETNVLLSSNADSLFFFKTIIISLAQTIITMKEVTLFVICSGTNATDLYSTIESSTIKYKEISLPLLSVENALFVIYSLASMDQTDVPPSLYFQNALELLGVVGRYLELYILTISTIGQSFQNVLPYSSTNFTVGGLRVFLQSCQNNAYYIQSSLKNFAVILGSHYNNYFNVLNQNLYVRQLVPLLAAYSLFEYPIDRNTCIESANLNLDQDYTVKFFEKQG